MTDQEPPSLPHPNQAGLPQTEPMGPQDHQIIALLLKQTRPWVLVIAVFMAIGAGLTLLGGLAFGVIFTAAPELGGFQDFPQGFGIGIAVLYFVFGAVYAIPAVWLFRYSGRITRYVETATIDTLSEAVSAQKSFWKFSGIAALAMIALYLVLMIVIFGVIASQGF